MKYLIVVAILFLSGCASSRVLVKDCQELKGTNLQNCILVEKL